MRSLELILVLIVAGCRPSPPVADTSGTLVDPDRLAEKVLALERRIESLEIGQEPIELPSHEPRIVKAEGFVLVDAAGKMVGRLGFDRLGNVDGIPGLYLYDKNGTKRLIAVYSGWGAGLALYDSHGESTLAFHSKYYYRINGNVRGGPTQREAVELGHPWYASGETLCPEVAAPSNYFSDGPPAN